MSLTKAAKLPLRQRAERHHMLGIPGDDSRRGIANSSGHAAATAAPVHVGELNLWNAKSPSQSCGIVTIVTVRGEPIDVFDAQTSISYRLLNSFQRQLKLADRRLACLVVTGFTNTDDG